MIDIKNASLVTSVMPSSLKQDKKVTDSAKALDPQLRDISRHTDDGMLLYKIDYLPSDVLDHLAMQWDAEVWRDSWPINVKRSVLKSLIPSKQKLGTMSSITAGLASLGSAVTVEEWFDKTPQGAPHTFSVILDQSQIEGTVDTELEQDIRSTINQRKPVRSQYSLAIMHKGSADLVLNDAAYMTQHVHIEAQLKDEKVEGAQRFYVSAFAPISWTMIKISAEGY